MNWHLFAFAEVRSIAEALVTKLVQAEATVHQDTCLGSKFPACYLLCFC